MLGWGSMRARPEGTWQCVEMVDDVDVPCLPSTAQVPAIGAAPNLSDLLILLQVFMEFTPGEEVRVGS